jgi:phytoene/squalene synthetase
VRSPQVRLALEHHASRARVFFARAVRELPRGDAHKFVAAEIMRAIYTALLQRIEGAGFDVFSRVHRVPKLLLARLAAGAWLKARRRAA